MGEVAASRLLWVLIMYVYRDVTSRALQCINLTSTVTRDSTACCLRLTSDRSQTAEEKKNGTSIGQRWDVFTGLRGCPLYIGRVYAHHHKWYITRDLSAMLLSRCVFENYLGFAAALNHLLTVLYFLWDLFCFFVFLFFTSFCCNDFWSFCLKSERLPQDRWRWRGNVEQIFVFACLSWNYSWQICSLFCTL